MYQDMTSFPLSSAPEATEDYSLVLGEASNINLQTVIWWVLTVSLLLLVVKAWIFIGTMNDFQRQLLSLMRNISEDVSELRRDLKTLSSEVPLKSHQESLAEVDTDPELTNISTEVRVKSHQESLAEVDTGPELTNISTEVQIKSHQESHAEVDTDHERNNITETEEEAGHSVSESNQEADNSLVNYEPELNFPAIPLPEIVEVVTGEEDEVIMFEERAKLFKFVPESKEWKERGLGQAKLLVNPQSGRVRFLMRREKTLTVCANHQILPNMRLEVSSSSRARLWTAQDFTFEELRLETFCIRFRSEEQVADFDNKFQEAVELSGNFLVVPGEDVEARENLSELSISGQALKLNTAEEAREICERIAIHSTLTSLTLSGNSIGIEAAGAIGGALETLPELRRADWRDIFTGRGKSEIPPALLSLTRGLVLSQTRLVDLDLSDNAIGPRGFNELETFFKSPSSFSLKVLRLNNTGCGVTGAKVLASLLTDCLHLSVASKQPLVLRVFCLGRNRLEDEGVTALASVLRLMGSLEEVVLPQNGIYRQGISALAQALAFNTKLRILNLNDNTLTAEGARALAKPLSQLSKLEVLDLGDCLLRSEGAKIICRALTDRHPALRELNLDSNEMTVESCPEIVNAVRDKPELVRLGIDSNQFGSSGLAMILGCLEDIGMKDIVAETENNEEADSEEEDQNPDSISKPSAFATSRLFAFGSTAVSSFTSSTSSTPTDPIETLGAFNFNLPLNPTGTEKSDPPLTQRTLGGFSFSKSPVVSPIKDTAEKPEAAEKDKNVPSQFASFSFGAAAGGSNIETINPPTTSNQKENAEEDAEDEPDVQFLPVIPLPELVDTRTPEEEEEDVLFSQQAKLFRFVAESKEWKEKGLGDFKILRQRESGKVRFLMRRDQVLNVCCNHLLSTDMQFTSLSNSTKTWQWSSQDFSQGHVVNEILALRFQTARLANKWKTIVDDCQAKLTAASAISTSQLKPGFSFSLPTVAKDTELPHKKQREDDQPVEAKKSSNREGFYFGLPSTQKFSFNFSNLETNKDEDQSQRRTPGGGGERV